MSDVIAFRSPLMDGERVRSARHLTRLVSETPVGRDVPFTIFGAGRDQAALDGFAEGGVERVTLLLRTRPESETLAELDELAELANKNR